MSCHQGLCCTNIGLTLLAMTDYGVPHELTNGDHVWLRLSIIDHGEHGDHVDYD